jgi:hypothetical protein
MLRTKGALTSLVPSLNGRSDGVEDDGEIKGSWMVPAVSLLKFELVTLSIFQAFDAFKTQRILCEQRSTLKKGEDFRQLVFIRKCFNIFKESFSRNADQWVADSTPCQQGKCEAAVLFTYSPVTLEVRVLTVG